MPEIVQISQSTQGKLLMTLDDESKRRIDELIGKLDFCGPILPRNDQERTSLGVARVRAASECVPLPTTLLRMLAESENERERTHGFVGTIRSLKKTVRIVRTERDTFSEQVDHLMRQVDACHAKIQALRDERDLMSAKCSAYDDAKNRSVEMENEIGQLRKELSEANGRTRTTCVRQMFVEVLSNQERNDRPTVPSEAAIRLQTRIDAEEFVEKFVELFDIPVALAMLSDSLKSIATHAPIRKDLHDRLPEFADALADNAVTNEGFAVLFGIDLESVFREVHKSNMAKKGGPIDEHGKRHKPEGWTAPDVAGVLRFQGWQPSSESKVDEPIPYRVVESASALSCEIHGFISGGHSSCIRCENARYNGSEVDPIGEQEAAPEVVTLFGLVDEDQNTILVKFKTKDRALVQRLQAIAREGRTILPEIEGKTYVRSKMPDIRVDCPTLEEERFVVSVGFRKVD